MIEAICKDCKHVFMTPVIMGITACPACGSMDTYVAILDHETKEWELGSKLVEAK